MAKFRTVPVQTLHDSLDYDPVTGKFMRKLPDTARGSLYARWNGKPTFEMESRSGYLIGAVNGRQYLAHRVAWAMHYGDWPHGQIDHINRVKTDNRIANLRVVDDRDNKQNLPLSKANTSGVLGVSWRPNRGKWRARINVGRKEISLGHFRSFDEAVAARRAAEVLQGFHPNHGKLLDAGGLTVASK